jgi:hypothetical protein
MSAVAATVMKLANVRLVSESAGVCGLVCEVVVGKLVVAVVVSIAVLPETTAFGCFGRFFELFFAI